MKGVMTLIKLHKRALDEKRRVLTNHEDQKIRLMQSLHMVQEVFNKEKQVIDETPEMAYSFIPFAEANKGKQQQLQQLNPFPNTNLDSLLPHLHLEQFSNHQKE